MICTTKMTTMSTTKMRKRTTSDVSPSVRKRLSSRLTYLVFLWKCVPIYPSRVFPQMGCGVNGRKFVTGRT